MAQQSNPNYTGRWYGGSSQMYAPQTQLGQYTLPAISRAAIFKAPWGTRYPTMEEYMRWQGKGASTYLSQLPDWLTGADLYRETRAPEQRIESMLDVLRDYGYGATRRGYTGPDYATTLSRVRGALGKPTLPEPIDPRVYEQEQIVGLQRLLREALQAEAEDRAARGFATSSLGTRQRGDIIGRGLESRRLATLAGQKARDARAELIAKMSNEDRQKLADIASDILRTRMLAQAHREATRTGLVEKLLGYTMV